MKKIFLMLAVLFGLTQGSLAQAAVKELGPAASKTLYKSLKMEAEDHDDIKSKKLKVEGLEIDCEYWVVETHYICTITTN